MSTPFYDLASLVVVPSGYKASKVYAQKPLTTDGQLTFSRASTATRVNASGLIETVSSNVPRLDYLGSTCPKLQLEPSRTNLALHSSTFNNAVWTKSSVTITADAILAPDGSTSADLFTTNDDTQTVFRAYETGSAAGQSTGTVSVFIKYGNHQYAFISQDDYSGITKFAVFDLINGTNTAISSGYSATITPYANGWYRVTLTGQQNTQAYLQVGLAPNSTTYAGSSIPNGKTAYFWGAQREYSAAYATSYIPTTTAAVTRLADACSKTGISSLIGQTEGTLYWELDIKIPTATGNEAIVNIDNGAGFGNTIFIYHSPAAQIVAETYVSSSSQSSFTKGSITAGVYKCALAYANNNTAFFVNGVQVGSTDTSCSVPATSRIQMGQTALSSDTSWTKQLLLFKTRLTNAQLAELTTL